MSARPYLIVVGASAGGMEALKRILSDLPPAFPAAIVIALHTPKSSARDAAGILSKHTKLQVRYAEEGVGLERGRAYLAPPDSHLIVREDRRLGLDHGPKVRLHRPAADPLFESAARVFGRQVIGLVLSGGSGDGDGSSGLREIKRHGGKSVVQSPSDAQAPEMPVNAIIHDNPDHVVMLDRIGPLLRQLVETST